MKQIDWDEIEDAVADYGDYRESAGHWASTKQETETSGFEATMVRIHNAVREGTSK